MAESLAHPRGTCSGRAVGQRSLLARRSTGTMRPRPRILGRASSAAARLISSSDRHPSACGLEPRAASAQQIDRVRQRLPGEQAPRASAGNRRPEASAVTSRRQGKGAEIWWLLEAQERSLADLVPRPEEIEKALPFAPSARGDITASQPSVVRRDE